MTRERASVPAHAPPAPRPVTASDRDAAEREADEAGVVAAGGTLSTGWSLAATPMSPPVDAEPDARAVEAVRGPGRPLDAQTMRAMEAGLQTDLSGVRLHDDARTVAATRAAGAEALTIGDDVALGTDRNDLASSRGRELLAHELTHVVQQRAHGSVATVQRKDGDPVPAATTLGGLPEADRKQIQIVTATVAVPGLAEKFSTTGTTVTFPFPAGATAAFDTSVDAALQHGLGNVAAVLSNGVDLTPTPLPPNSTVTLELDVGGTVGKGLYRFTHHAPSAPPGAKGVAAAPRIIVEALGKATAPAGTKAPPAAKEGATPAADPVADKIKRHSFSQSYTGTELDALRAALDQIPDAQLAVVDGPKFRRDNAKATDPDASGDYDSKTHTVTMYDKAFTSSQTRFKGPGAVASESTTRAIVHEIGHAVDLAALRKAGAEQTKATAAVDALSTKYPDPKDPKAFQYPLGGPEEKEVKAVLQAQKDADAALTSARALSGTKSVKKPGTAEFEDVIGTSVAGIKFREAATKDGGKAVSKYGDKDWQEAFAEAYSLYITSPETLKSLRPNVYDFLDKNLPK